MERRFQTSEIEVRQNDEGNSVISGYAAVFYRKDDPGTEFELFENVRERITPQAFDRALEQQQDVRALFNHDPNMLLGRTTSSTLRLEKTKRGLRYEIELPDTTAGRDVRASLERRDLSGSSFAFRVTGERWTTTEEGEVREITDVDLLDVGPVTYPAYASTTSGLREDFVAECRSSLEAWQEHKQLEREQLEKELESYQVRARLAAL